MHIFEEGEDAELSKPVTINMKVFTKTTGPKHETLFDDLMLVLCWLLLPV